MKLIGYVRLKGERDGKSYDDYRLYIEEKNENAGSEIGGSQILMNRTQYGSYFPKVPYETFNRLLHQGLRIGSEIRCYRDLNNKLIVELV